MNCWMDKIWVYLFRWSLWYVTTLTQCFFCQLWVVSVVIAVSFGRTTIPCLIIEHISCFLYISFWRVSSVCQIKIWMITDKMKVIFMLILASLYSCVQSDRPGNLLLFPFQFSLMWQFLHMNFLVVWFEYSLLFQY